jgi:hypothetical protein
MVFELFLYVLAVYLCILLGMFLHGEAERRKVTKKLEQLLEKIRKISRHYDVDGKPDDAS